MSLWHTHPRNFHHQVAAMSVIAIGVMVVSLFMVQHAWQSRTAAIVDAAASSSPLPVAENTFDQPRPIVWDGYIRRVLAGGEGLEIVSPAAQGGVFQAYMKKGEISPVTEGVVLVRGSWIGYTCAYGGQGEGCVPEVAILSIQSQSIELE